jgi:hypothetical protein
MADRSQTSGVNNSNPLRNITQPAANWMKRIGVMGGRKKQVTPSKETLTPGAASVSPLFGRPPWSYSNIQQGPVRGPNPRLSWGSGLTGDHSGPGNASSLPGYVSEAAYFPSTFSYDPVDNPNFTRHIPRSIGQGDDGLHALNPTYKAHDNTQADRFFHQNRQAASWQVYEYPPDYRQLLQYQQVQKYRTQSFTLSPRPLDSSNYFLGYQINPQIAAQIGQGTLGYMGSQ